MVFICLKYGDEENKDFEGIVVSEVRGKFGKKKWPKAETRGKLFSKFFESGSL